MKKIRRELTVTVEVPDHVDVKDVEIATVAKVSCAGQELDGTIVARPLYVVESEPPVRPKPVCPKCAKEIDHLIVYWPATVTGIAELSNDELRVELDYDFNDPKDVAREDEQTYHCPECDEQFFKAGDEDEVTNFLKGGA